MAPTATVLDIIVCSVVHRLVAALHDQVLAGELGDMCPAVPPCRLADLGDQGVLGSVRKPKIDAELDLAP